MAGSIHLGDIGAPALDTTSERLGTALSADHETTFEQQAHGGASANGPSRSMPGSFPEDTPPPSPTASTHSAAGSFTGSVGGEGAHTPSISDGAHTPSTAPSVGDADGAHTPSTAPSVGDRFEQAGAAEEGNAPQAGRLSRWSERNYKFGDMFDKALKPYTVPLTAGGVTAGLGIGIYNAVKK